MFTLTDFDTFRFQISLSLAVILTQNGNLAICQFLKLVKSINNYKVIKCAVVFSAALMVLVGCQSLNLVNPVVDWGKSRSFLHAGDAATKKGQWDVALEQYQQASKLTPRDPVILARLSESNWELGNQTRAINQMAEAVQASDYDPQLLIELARMNLEYGNLDRALEAIDQVVQREPKLVEPRIFRGRLYKQMAMPSKALDDFHFALGNLSEDDEDQRVDIQLDVAEIYIWQHRFENALSIVTTIPIAKIDDQPVIRVYQIHATALQQLGRLDEATEKLEMALKFDGDHTQTYFRLAEVHTAANNHSGAALALRQTLALSPEHAGALQMLQQLPSPQ